jgi:hypothetical protein
VAEPCQKTTYHSEHLARREARRLGDESGEPFREYVCSECGRWHLSTNGTRNDAPRGRRGPLQKHWPKRVHTAEEMEALAAEMRASRCHR